MNDKVDGAKSTFADDFLNFEVFQADRIYSTREKETLSRSHLHVIPGSFYGIRDDFLFRIKDSPRITRKS